jgi:NADPH2:quinone reductase
VNLTENLKALETGGRITVIGMGAGSTGEINLGLLLMKRGRIHGSTLRARPLEQKALTARGVERSVLPLLASGAVKVPIAKTFPMDDAAAAYEHFAAGGKLGKIILEMDQ